MPRGRTKNACSEELQVVSNSKAPLIAEEEGFAPPETLSSLTAFKTVCSVMKSRNVQDII